MRLIRFWAPLGFFLLSMIAGCDGDGDGPASPNRLTVLAGVWTVSASSGAVLRLAPDDLNGSGGKAPATLITTPSARFFELGAVAFDRDGTLWAASSGESLLLAFSLETLRGSGSKVASKVITPIDGSLAGPTGLAFDPLGRLWVANNGNGIVVRFDRSQLAAGGAPVPSVVLQLGGAPAGIAFDEAGNLWVSDNVFSTVSRYDASKLETSGPLAEDFRLSFANGLSRPTSIAIDAAGNLWIANIGTETVVSFTPAQVAGIGLPAPHVVLSSNEGSLTLPAGLAFDGDGNLWVVGGLGTLTQFDRGSLAESGAPEPRARVQVTGQRFLWNAAFWPIPVGLPLH